MNVKKNNGNTPLLTEQNMETEIDSKNEISTGHNEVYV